MTVIESDKRGCICYDDFEKAIRPETRVIVCTNGSNLTGNRLDIERVGKIAADHGIRFIVDASQTAGVFAIDVQKMHIDILCFTGHKGSAGTSGNGWNLCSGRN